MRVAVFAAVVTLGTTAASAADLPLLPGAAAVTLQSGSFSFAHARILASDPGERAAAERLRSLVARSGRPGLSLAPRGRVHFHRDPAITGAEAYRIEITPRGVDVAASSAARLYYGREPLRQLMASSGPSKHIHPL